MHLPFPADWKRIRILFERVDDRLLSCSETFIRQQVKRPLVTLLQGQVSSFPLETPQSDWFNIYSVYSANQQLNEACNKAWATIELAHMTDKDVWKKSYHPVGRTFAGKFLLGTLIPNLYYSQISAVISILSVYGCVPVLVNRRHLFLVRTKNGWMIFERQRYMRENFGFGAKSWHDQILKTYVGLRNGGIRLPKLDVERTFSLKEMRNTMQYEVLGDLRMWRMFRDQKTYHKFLPLVTETISRAIDLLQRTKKVTTGCDKRFEDLVANYLGTKNS